MVTSYTVLVCTQCKREEREDSAINWIRTEGAGIGAACVGDMPVDGLFCKVGCLAAYFALTDAKAEWREEAAQPI